MVSTGICIETQYCLKGDVESKRTDLLWSLISEDVSVIDILVNITLGQTIGSNGCIKWSTPGDLVLFHVGGCPTWDLSKPFIHSKTIL